MVGFHANDYMDLRAISVVRAGMASKLKSESAEIR